LSHPSRLSPAFIPQAVEQAVRAALPGAAVRVEGGGGHYRLRVVSELFAGKSLLQKQRLVYSAITELMRGDDAPLHAVDEMRCLTPSEAEREAS
jgi:acid stress-induced BolA-like protein IbaG/YrbA